MSSRLGMNQTLASQTTASGSLRKRPAARGAPKRSGDCWDSVSIVSEQARHNAAGGRVQCNYCSYTAPRRTSAAPCAFGITCAARARTGESEEFIQVKERLLAQRDTFEVKKAKRTAEAGRTELEPGRLELELVGEYDLEACGLRGRLDRARHDPFAIG